MFVSELNADFNVKRVPMTVSNIEDSIKVLVVVDPKNITDMAQFAIDQFVMRGGKLIAFLDSTSLVDKQSDNPMMSQMPGSGSSLDKLLKAWGIDFDPTKTVADRKYKVKLGGANNQPDRSAGLSGFGRGCDQSRRHRHQ